MARTDARPCDASATPSAWSRRTTGSTRASARLRRTECARGDARTLFRRESRNIARSSGDVQSRETRLFDENGFRTHFSVPCVVRVTFANARRVDAPSRQFGVYIYISLECVLDVSECVREASVANSGVIFFADPGFFFVIVFDCGTHEQSTRKGCQRISTSVSVCHPC